MPNVSGSKQPAEQQREQGQRKPHHNIGRAWGRPFPPGVDGRAWLAAEKVRRIADMVRELADELGGIDALPPFKRAMLRKAAELLLSSQPRHWFADRE